MRFSTLLLAVLLVGYVAGHTFWHLKLGPAPVTLDRLLLVAAGALLAWHWRWNVLPPLRLTPVDWAVAATVTWLTLSAYLNRPVDITLPEPPLGRLLASFWIPAAIYFIARRATVDGRVVSQLFLALTCLGAYLALTAIAESAGLWSLVFPRYIADPTVGLHFGRARGPAVNSVSLGVYLSICFWAAWLLRPRLLRPAQLVVITLMALMAVGVFLTYTRSTWIGLLLSGLVVMAVQLPRSWRLPALGGAMAASILCLPIAWNQLMGLKREGTASESRHSVSQRAAFAYVSWQMFKNNPIAGVGFGRFYDQKLPYLSDRSQAFELESIRKLHHHNTFLGMLTETGLIGLVAFCAMLIGWGRCAWRVVRADDLPYGQRQLGLLLLATLAIYLSSAVFHDLSHLPNEQVVLFLIAGLTVAAASHRKSLVVSRWNVTIHHSPTHLLTYSPLTMNSHCVDLFGMRIDNVDLATATERLLDWCHQPATRSCRYVVTPNVDHAVMFQARPELRAAYASAAMVVADGAPLVWASRLLRRPLPERVAGSDLIPSLLKLAASHREPLRVFLLGAAPGVAERAAQQIHQRWNQVAIVGTLSPPLGFETDAAENDRILAAISKAQPDLLVIGLGAPKQELWIARHHDRLAAKVAICAGATIDFLAAEKQRSPVWMRRLGLEWFHRLASEPRRLAARYARDAWVFPQLVWREWRGLGG